MQAIVELALEAPFELWMIQVTRVKLEIVRMHRKLRILELDDDLDCFALGAGVEDKQRMLVEPKLSQYPFETLIVCLIHQGIVKVTATAETTAPTSRHYNLLQPAIHRFVCSSKFNSLQTEIAEIHS